MKRFISLFQPRSLSIQEMEPGTQIRDLIPSWYRHEGIDPESRMVEQAVVYTFDRWIEQNNLDPQKIATQKDLNSLEAFLRERMLETLHAALVQGNLSRNGKSQETQPKPCYISA